MENKTLGKKLEMEAVSHAITRQLAKSLDADIVAGIAGKSIEVQSY